MKICINGIGNIGTTLALILQKYKVELNINEVIAFKNKLQPWQKTDLEFLQNKGIAVVDGQTTPLQTILPSIDFIFDTTSNGHGLVNKDIYSQFSNLKGAIAQGSENGFGKQFMNGLPITLQSEKYAQIVSCNTHAAAALLNLFDSFRLTNTKMADFVVVRRSEDLGNHTRLVTANVVARHLSDSIGTHHGIDVKSMFAQLNIDCPITSSDITTPSQLMHSTRFHIETKNEINWDSFNEKLLKNPLVATTSKFDSNTIFELGRRYGDYGRIYNHVVLVENNMIKTSHSVKGWAFVPQEGNTILSTIEAFIRMTKEDSTNKKMAILTKKLCPSVW